MTRDEIEAALHRIFLEKFEIENPGIDEDLRDVYEFDSIDAIELLQEIEMLLDRKLTRPEKKMAMEMRTIRDIMGYIDNLSLAENPPGSTAA